MDFQQRRKAAVIAVGVASGLLLADLSRTVLSSLRHLAVLFGVALFVSFVIEPVVARLERAGWRRGAATFVAMVGLIVFFATVIGVGGAVISTQGTQLLDRLPQIAASLQQRLASWGVDVDLVSMTRPGGRLDGFAETLRDQLLAASGKLVAQVGNFLTMLFLVFYLSADGHKLLASACSLLPPARQQHVVRAWELAIEKAGGYMYSRFVLAAASAAVHAVAFVALGVDYPLPLALWVGVVSQLIPVIGTYLAGALPVIVALGVSPARALGVVVVITVYQQVENMVLAPRVTRQVVSVHPLAGFLAVLGSVSLLGPVGALVAIPILATVVAFTSSLVTRHEVVSTVAPPSEVAFGAETAANPATGGERVKGALRRLRGALFVDRSARRGGDAGNDAPPPASPGR